MNGKVTHWPHRYSSCDEWVEHCANAKLHTSNLAEMKAVAEEIFLALVNELTGRGQEISKELVEQVRTWLSHAMDGLYGMVPIGVGEDFLFERGWYWAIKGAGPLPAEIEIEVMSALELFCTLWLRNCFDLNLPPLSNYSVLAVGDRMVLCLYGSKKRVYEVFDTDPHRSNYPDLPYNPLFCGRMTARLTSVSGSGGFVWGFDWSYLGMMLKNYCSVSELVRPRVEASESADIGMKPRSDYYGGRSGEQFQHSSWTKPRTIIAWASETRIMHELLSHETERMAADRFAEELRRACEMPFREKVNNFGGLRWNVWTLFDKVCRKWSTFSDQAKVGRRQVGMFAFWQVHWAGELGVMAAVERATAIVIERLGELTRETAETIELLKPVFEEVANPLVWDEQTDEWVRENPQPEVEAQESESEPEPQPSGPVAPEPEPQAEPKGEDQLSLF